MKIASVAEVKSQFSAFLKSSAGGPVVVTRNGKPVAVLVGIEDEDEIERLLMAYSPRLRAICDLSRQQIAEGKGVSHEQFWAGVGVRKASETARQVDGEARVTTAQRPNQGMHRSTRSGRK